MDDASANKKSIKRKVSSTEESNSKRRTLNSKQFLSLIPLKHKLKNIKDSSTKKFKFKFKESTKKPEYIEFEEYI